MSTNTYKRFEEKQQKTPNLRVGDTLYSARINTYDDGKIELEIIPWVVRVICADKSRKPDWIKRVLSATPRPKVAYLTAHIKDVTWVRQSRKVADYGWSRSIPEHLRKKAPMDGVLPWGVFTTKLRALTDLKRRTEHYLKHTKAEQRDPTISATLREENAQYIKEYEKELRVISSRITRTRKEK